MCQACSVVQLIQCLQALVVPHLSYVEEFLNDSLAVASHTRHSQTCDLPKISPCCCRRCRRCRIRRWPCPGGRSPTCRRPRPLGRTESCPGRGGRRRGGPGPPCSRQTCWSTAGPVVRNTPQSGKRGLSCKFLKMVVLRSRTITLVPTHVFPQVFCSR